MCQTIMAELSKIIDTVTKLVLIFYFSLSMYKCSYFLGNSLCILCLPYKYVSNMFHINAYSKIQENCQQMHIL